MLSTPEVVAVTVIAAAIVACANYVLKKSVPKFELSPKSILSLARNRMLIAGLAIYGMGLVFYLFGLGSGELSFVYPAFSSTFIFVMLIAHFKLGEKTTPARLCGVALIILGIALVSGMI